MSREPQEPVLEGARVERAAWVLGVLVPSAAEAMLAGLSPRLQAPARAALGALAALDSASRQRRLAHAFGERDDAERCLRELGRGLPGPLRARLARLAPLYLRDALTGSETRAGEVRPELPTTARPAQVGASGAEGRSALLAPPHPGAEALAARLLREALR